VRSKVRPFQRRCRNAASLVDATGYRPRSNSNRRPFIHAVQIDSTHLSLTFAGYGVQTPNKDLLNYRQIGNVVLTVSKELPPGVPNNINAH
jgi:hypothetical protein